jgi:hypothetical protein
MTTLRYIRCYYNCQRAQNIPRHQALWIALRWAFQPLPF